MMGERTATALEVVKQELRLAFYMGAAFGVLMCSALWFLLLHFWG